MNELVGAKIAAALLKAQKEIEGVSKDAENPHFKSKFADLTSVIEATVPILNKHGIVVIQLPTPGAEGTLALTTLLLHESGESISGTAVVPLSKQDPQGYGSAMTYARRYSLGSAVALKFLDDDGEAAVGRRPVPPPPAGITIGAKKPALLGTAKPEAALKRRVGELERRVGDGPEPTKAPARGKTGLFPKVSATSDEEGGEDNAE